MRGKMRRPLAVASAQDLRRVVQEFLTDYEMAPTRFGREAVSDANFVKKLENGHDYLLSTVTRVLEFIALYEVKNGD